MSSTFPLIISDIHRQILRNCLRFYFLVTVHVKTHFQAFLRLKGKREELESRTHESISDLFDLFVQVRFTGSLHDDLTRLEAFPVIFSAVLYKHFL